MIEVLSKVFVKNNVEGNVNDERRQFGVLLGGVGIFFNIILFTIKIVASLLTGSVAIIADAFNNLSDAGSSFIQMIGYKLSGQKPDSEHPYGHGRIEYVSGLIISIIIIIVGFQLLSSSIDKIIHPVSISYSKVTIIILCISVFIKLYMYSYNLKYSKKYNSVVMQATAYDSLSDCLATSIVLIAAMISEYTGMNIDGYSGILVSAFIIYTGVTSARDTISPLLGEKPDKEFVNKIETFVMSFDDISGVHDLVVHDYGAGRMMVSLHAEVPATGDIVKIHDTIDNIEKRLSETLGCHAVIHMDPVVTDDEVTIRMNRLCTLIAKSIDESLTIHDFRMVAGPTHTNLIFDVVVPFEMKMTESEVKKAIEDKVSSIPGNLIAVIDIDRPMC